MFFENLEYFYFIKQDIKWTSGLIDAKHH